MYQFIHQAAFYLHIAIGAVALIVFWLPLVAKKGSASHRKYGKIFTYSMYILSISGVIMTLLVIMDPIAIRFPDKVLSPEQIQKISYQNRVFSSFLFMLSILTFCSTRHSVAVLKVKANRVLLKTTNYLSPIILLGLLGGLMAWFGFDKSIILFKFFGVLSMVVSFGMLRYIFKAEVKQREWIVEHLGSILGAGIAAYTAFFVFGGQRIFSIIFSGDLQFVPWILPSVVGVTAIVFFSKKFRKQFRVS
ncbi:MAG: hypothetical protein COA74_12240 [Gammaproteobacteria bacterium]|nr:MAG: hypothetical protein COA74_12240 [Gammaproteobacteria bacterium]